MSKTTGKQVSKTKVKNSILKLYVLKRIKERADAMIQDFKSELLELSSNSGESNLSEQIGSSTILKVTFAEVKGRKSFSPTKALEFLKKQLSKLEFQNNFTHLEISRKKGSFTPPPELLKEMEKYFVIDRVESIEEEQLANTDFGIPKEMLDKHCYEQGTGYTKMLTPSKVSDTELAKALSTVKLDMGQELLLEE